MFDDDDHNDNDNQGDVGRGYDTSGDSVGGHDGATIEDYVRTFIRAAVAVTPLSERGKDAAMILIDDMARSWREHRDEEDLREEAERRAKEDRAERELEAAGLMREATVQARHEAASATAALQRARLEAAVQECQLRQELADALSRAASAEAALAALVPAHWAATQLREAALQQERHIVSTVEIAEGLGASRVDLERALRQHIAERAAQGSRLALDLLLSPLGTHEDPEPQGKTPKKGKNDGVARRSRAR